MRKIILFAFTIIGVTACSTQSSLYNWDKYTNTSYAYYKKQTPEANEALMKTYERMIKRADSGSAKIAPGIYAEYGYFLIQNGKSKEGIEMLKKEKEKFPESAIFMDRLIKQFSK